MTGRDALLPAASALGLGLAGAAVASRAGLPAGALIGAALAVAAAAGAGLPVSVDPRLRNLGFGVIGVSLGAGVDRGVLEAAGPWSLSLALLAASVAATLAVGAALLRRGFGMGRDTAILSSSPGTLSYAIAIAVEGRGDASTVLVMQSLRLLLLATVLPPLVVWLGHAPSAPPRPPPMGGAALLATLAGAAALGWTGGRAGLPAAWFVGGMAASAAIHLAGAASGPPPSWLLFAGFAVTGASIGARFSGMALATLRGLVGASLAAVAVAGLVSAAFAALTHALTGLPLGQIWIAYAPGGVEAMAAIGLAFGYDPAFVALHHLARILLLVVLLPVVMARTRPGR